MSVPVQYKFLSITVKANEDFCSKITTICNDMLKQNFMLKDQSITLLEDKSRDVILSFEKY